MSSIDITIIFLFIYSRIIAIGINHFICSMKRFGFSSEMAGVALGWIGVVVNCMRDDKNGTSSIKHIKGFSEDNT